MSTSILHRGGHVLHSPFGHVLQTLIRGDVAPTVSLFVVIGGRHTHSVSVLLLVCVAGRTYSVSALLLVCFAVHLRIREVDQLIPKSLYPSTSGNTYWQIEAESSILNGQYLYVLTYLRTATLSTYLYTYCNAQYLLIYVLQCSALADQTESSTLNGQYLSNNEPG